MFHPNRRDAVQWAALAAASPWNAFAQSSYPDRPLRLIVPTPPGDLPSTFARLVGDSLAKRLGQPVVVENRPGAGGSIGTRALLQAPADGYTLLWTYISNQVITALIQRPAPYHPLEDFAPIALSIVNTGGFLVASTKHAFKTPRQLFAYANANPGKLNFASAGIGSITHLAIEVIKQRTGTDIVHVPYNGNAPATLATVSGDADLAVASSLPAALPFLESGKLRLIARLGEKRHPDYPDVPTLFEDTVPGFTLPFWMGLAARAGTPADIITRLNKEVNAAVATDPMIQRQAAISFLETVDGPPARLRDVVVRDFEVFGKVVRDNNITAGG